MSENWLLEGMRFSIGDTEFRISFNYSLSYPEIDENQQTIAHDHSYIELHIVSEGVLHIKADEDFFVKKNEILMIAPGVYHSTEMSEVRTMRYAVGIEFFKKSGAMEKTYSYFKELFGSFSCIKLTHCQSIIMGLLKIRRLLNSDKVFVPYRIKNYIAEMLFDICDNMESHRQQHSEEQDRNAKREDDWDSEDRLCIALDAIITLNGKNGFKTLDEIGHDLFLDKQQINRIMKRRYNMTFKQKQIFSRIEYAKNILYQTDKSIDAIAYEIGYTNITSFYKNFKKVVGCTPNEFRKRVKNTNKK